SRYCNEIRRMPGCASCVAIRGWPATYRDPRDSVFTAAVGPEINDVFPDYGLTANVMKDLLRDKRAASVGRALMKKYGWKLGQQVTLRSADAFSRMDLTFIITADIPSKHYPNAFIFRRDYFNEAMKANGHPDDDIAWQLIARADSPDHVASLSREIDDHFRNSSYETRTMTEQDALSNGLSAIGNIRAIVYSLCAIVILTVWMIAGNSAAMMVRDRINEVAVMRALGFGPAHIANLLFGECALIGMLGGALGAGLALYLFSEGVSLGAALGGTAGSMFVTPAGATQGLIASIVVAAASGAIPIVRAIRISPALGFREVV
ncbi:MAG TPA: ABC transporter permease, partial [Candidatus Binataceae bacterium]|nr:ABC transporter permease [Candidatus Binataceae bacterium]